jgi:hypothetical protein
MKNDRLWVATGNNMVLGGDLDRRVVWVTVDPGMERPEDRDDFTIPDLAAHVTRHRARILADLLTMLAAWDVAGRPAGKPTSDSFGTWVAAVRGVLAVCDVPGTFDHHSSRSDTVDPDAEEAAAFLAAVHQLFGTGTWTAKSLVEAMVDPSRAAPVEPKRYDWEAAEKFAERSATYAREAAAHAKGVALVEAYPTAARGRYWRPGTPYAELTKPLGYWLRHREGQWFGGRRVEKAHRGRGGAEYRVALAEGSGVAL